MTMKYGDAYMREAERAQLMLCRWYYPQILLRKRRLGVSPLSVELHEDLKGSLCNPKAILSYLQHEWLSGSTEKYPLDEDEGQ
jgi:hypothetical protein